MNARAPAGNGSSWKPSAPAGLIARTFREDPSMKSPGASTVAQPPLAVSGFK
jgi:hypothetical protein